MIPRLLLLLFTLLPIITSLLTGVAVAVSAPQTVVVILREVAVVVMVLEGLLFANYAKKMVIMRTIVLICTPLLADILMQTLLRLLILNATFLHLIGLSTLELLHT